MVKKINVIASPIPALEFVRVQPSICEIVALVCRGQHAFLSGVSCERMVQASKQGACF